MSGERLTGRILNFNVGVLGHVDSGKTSLARALSTVASTAAFDKVRRVERAEGKKKKTGALSA
jgi:translation elongation factor EF-Tu-like GTPase